MVFFFKTLICFNIITYVLLSIMKKSPAAVIEKMFAHSFIRWQIKNFSLAACQENFVTSSPQFLMHKPEVTDWKLQLQVTPSEDCDSVSVCLERLNQGPDKVWVNWKVIFLDDSDGIKPDYECECFFGRKEKHAVDLQSVQRVLDMLDSEALDTLDIMCQIIVKHESNAETLSDEITVSGLKSLSQDFGKMFRRGKYYDLVLRIGDKDIRAHKSVLKYRNFVLGDLISTAEHSKIVTISELDAEATEAVMLYLYTGNLYYVIGCPSIALYKCIQFFDIEDLKHYFFPERISIKSKIESQEVSFKWVIPNFSQRKKAVRSQDMKKFDINLQWRIHVYPYGLDDCTETIAIYVEIVQTDIFQDVYIEFATVDGFNKRTNNVKVKGLLASGEWIGNEYFLSRYSLEEVSPSGHLCVSVRISVPSRNQVSSIFYEDSSYSTKIYTLSNFLSLSGAMRDLFENTSHQDVTLRAKSVELEAHKCILDARSKTLSQILGKFRDNIVIEVEDDILKIFLEYIYSGFLQESQISVLFHLYKAAELYKIPYLKSDCCICLLSQLNGETVSEILEFAEVNQVDELRSASFLFIQNHKTDVPVNSK